MESAVSIEHAKHAMMVFGLILMLGTVSGLLARLTKVPDVVIFLLAGMAVGPTGFGWVDIAANSELNQLILIFGSSLHPVRRRGERCASR